MNPTLRQKFADAWAQVLEAITRGLKHDEDLQAHLDAAREERDLLCMEKTSIIGHANEQTRRLQNAQSNEERLSREVETLKQTIEKMTEAHMATRYRPTGLRDQYGLNLLFEPYDMGFNSMGKDHIFYVAEAIGRQVAKEIATARFVRKTEYEPQERPRPDVRAWTPGGGPPPRY